MLWVVNSKCNAYYFDGSKWCNTVGNLKQVSAGESAVFGLHATTNHLCKRSVITSANQKGTKASNSDLYKLNSLNQNIMVTF